MTHDELKGSLPALALGALDRDEQALVSAHLATCEDCRAELATLQRVVNGIGLEAEPVTPPAGLRAKVLDRVAREPQTTRPVGRSAGARGDWFMPLALAASMLVAAAAAFYAYQMRADLADLRRVNAIVQATDTVRVDLKGQETAAGATARAFWNKGRGLVFQASQLPALPAGRVYQLWTIKGNVPTSAGLLVTDGQGGGSLTITLPADAARPDAFGVTIEPAGGSASPTLPIVLIGATPQ